MSKASAPTCDVKFGNERMKQVDRLKYLESTKTKDGRSESETKQRIGIARNAFGKMRNVFSNRCERLATRMRVIKTCKSSPMLYGCEA